MDFGKERQIAPVGKLQSPMTSLGQPWPVYKVNFRVWLEQSSDVTG